jgi:hypothetical protein
MSFAKGTIIAPARSREQIEKLVRAFGASSFASGWEANGAAAITFVAKGRTLRFTVPMPDRKDPKIRLSGRGYERSVRQIDDAVEGEERRRWRALLLVIKAKLESVESGIETFEQAFLANVVIPGSGETIGEWAAPQIAAAYARGSNLPRMLGPGT